MPNNDSISTFPASMYQPDTTSIATSTSPARPPPPQQPATPAAVLAPHSTGAQRPDPTGAVASVARYLLPNHRNRTMSRWSSPFGAQLDPPQSLSSHICRSLHPVPHLPRAGKQTSTTRRSTYEHSRVRQGAGNRLRTLIVAILSLALTTLLVTWLTGFFSPLLPEPARAWLAIKNTGTRVASQSDGFSVVLCWLDGDRDGKDTANVALAFTGVPGITLVRSARIVAATGAADGWRGTMGRRSRAVLDHWNGDLAVVGVVKKSGEVLSLWFVPRQGEGTLGRADLPYKLEDVTLGDDFHDDLRSKLTAVALVALAPFADTATQGRIIEDGLEKAAHNLQALLDSRAIRRADRVAILNFVLGNALQTLGERESANQRLEQAVEFYRSSLKAYAPSTDLKQWAAVQNNLANVLLILGNREGHADRIREAIELYVAVLEELGTDRGWVEWAITEMNIGNAHAILADLQGGADELELALAAHQRALAKVDRERNPLVWAMVQGNIGNILLALGQRQRDTDTLFAARRAYMAALEEYTLDRVPLSRARLQNNLGVLWQEFARSTRKPDDLQFAVRTHRLALRALTQERAALDWASTQNHLGNALTALGELNDDTGMIREAEDAYRAALRQRTREHTPLLWAATQSNLGDALAARGERHRSPQLLRGAEHA